MEFISQAPSWGIDLPQLYFDGGAYIEDNIGTFGWIIYENGEIIRRGYGVFRRSERELTPHYAEFVAVIKGLQAMLDLNYDRVRVKGDNIHVLTSLENASVWDDPEIQQGSDLARRLFHSFPSFKEAEKIHRAENFEADALARDAFHVYQNTSKQAETDPIFNAMKPAPSVNRKSKKPVNSFV